MLALSLPALLLGVACGVLYSAADYFRKAAPPSCPPQTILFYYVGGQIPVLAAWVLWSGETTIEPGYLLPGIVDATFGLMANLLFIVAIRRSSLSFMVPLLALVPISTLIVGGLSLGEWPTLKQDIGIALIATGLFTLYQPAGTKPTISAAWATLRVEKGTIPMLGVILLWSTTPALDKICLGYTSPGLHSLSQVVMIWSALLVWTAFSGWRFIYLLPGARGPVAAAAAVGGLGYAAQLVAYSLTFVALIEVLKRTVGLFGSLLLGRTAFREPITPTKIIGIGIIAAGLPLVMLA